MGNGSIDWGHHSRNQTLISAGPMDVFPVDTFTFKPPKESDALTSKRVIERCSSRLPSVLMSLWREVVGLGKESSRFKQFVSAKKGIETRQYCSAARYVPHSKEG